MFRKANDRESRIAAEMAVLMWGSYTVDELEKEFGGSGGADTQGLHGAV